MCKRAVRAVRRNWLLPLVAAFLFCAGSARSQEPVPTSQGDLERRVKELEATVRRLERERPKNEPADSSPTVPSPDSSKPFPAADINSEAKSTSVLAGWDNGFFLKSADNRFKLRITGQIQAD